MKTFTLQRISDALLDCTVTSPNGARYVVQIYDTRTRAGFQAVIQRVGAADSRPLNRFAPNSAVALAEINNVLKRIGVEVIR